MKVDITSIFLPGIIYIVSFLLHVLNANRCSTPAATVFPIPCLCFDFRSVLEGHSDIVFAVDCDEIHQAAPKPSIELLDVIRVIVHLCGIAGNLVIMVRGNTGITSYSPILPAVNRGQ